MYQHQMSNEYEVIKETSTPCNDCKLQASIRCTDCKVEQRQVDNMMPSFVQSGNMNSSSSNNDNDRKGAPSPNDVVCARGRSYWNHPGNRMYRKLIAMAKTDYLTASNRFEKSVIVSKIMDAVHDKSGVFVKKVVTSKSNDGDGDGNARWVECSEAFVREKIAQSIRDGLPFKYSSSTSRKRERAAQAQKEAANEKNKRDYEKKLQNDLFYPRKVTSAMKQPQSMSGAATAPSSLSLMLESTFLGGRSDGSTQHYDTANIANQAMEILSDDVKHIFDDDRMAGGIEVDRIESMGNGPAHHGNNGDFSSKQQNGDNHDLWEHNHLHDDLEPMPLSSDEEDEAMQLELLQLTAHNDHVDLFPRPFADGLIDGSRGGDRRCSNYIRSSSNNNNNDWLEGMDHKKPSADTSSSRNSNSGGRGNSGDVYQNFMRQHWEDLPIELSPSNIAEEIVTTFQPQED